MRRWLAALAALFISHSALAQTFPAGWNQVGPSVAITASGSSSTVKLGWVGAQPQAPPLALVCNYSAVVAYVAPVQASTTTVAVTAAPVFGGSATNPTCSLLQLGGAQYVAAITGGSSASLVIYSGSGALFGSLPSGPGGGGGAGGGLTQLTGDVTAGPGTGSQAATVSAIGGQAISLGGPLSTTGTDTVVFAMPSTGTPTYTFPSTSGTLGTGNALFGTATGNTANDIVTMSNTTVGVQDSGTLLSSLAPKASPTLVTPTLGVAIATSINGLSITTTTGTLTIANSKTLTDTSGVGADLLIGAAGGGFAAYGGTSSAGSVLTALSAAGAGSFLAYTNANTASTLVERDGSGNFTAGTISASLTGHASLDLALGGGTMSGNIAMGGGNISGGGTFTATTLAGTLSTAAQPNITSLGTIAGPTFSGTLTGPVGFSVSGTGYLNLNSGGGSAWIDSVSNATALTNAGLTGHINQLMQRATADYAGIWYQGVSVGDMYFGMVASADDLIASTANTASPVELFRIAQAGGVTVGSPTGGAKGAGTLNISGLYYANGTVGVSCPANTVTTLTEVVTNGIITHC